VDAQLEKLSKDQDVSVNAKLINFWTTKETVTPVELSK